MRFSGFYLEDEANTFVIPDSLELTNKTKELI